VHLRIQRVSLDIINDIVEEYQAPSTRKGIIIHYQRLEPNEVCVLADKQSLRQIFDNLLSNAIKYSPHWKPIYVRVFAVANEDTTREHSNCVRVEIQDEGPGISEDDKKKLFGKFVRLTAQPTGGEHSTGLGLSIVKKLVELNNGNVWCESTLGLGTTFIVELPVSIEAFAPPESST
jgi:signal transduction histidine kinase